jgi:hypothetical protein
MIETLANKNPDFWQRVTSIRGLANLSLSQYMPISQLEAKSEISEKFSEEKE